jgi:hypothetical protein
MNPALAALILQLAAQVAPEIGGLLTAFIRFLTAQLDGAVGSQRDKLIMGVRKIILGIDEDHPKWSGDKKREWAMSAIRQLYLNLALPDPGRMACDAWIVLVLSEQRGRDTWRPEGEQP